MTQTPLDICIASPGLAHHGGTLGERSLGGSETAAIQIAKSLVRRGHFVTVFSPGHQGGQWDGVTYQPLEQFTAYATTTAHDVTIISRALELLPVVYASKLVVLWCHDLALKRMLPQLSPGLWNVDALYVLSDFQRQQYLETYAGLPPEQLVVTRNGVDLPAVAGVGRGPRDPLKLVYGSRPERGLETCLLVMDELARRGSPATLAVAWYDNMPAQLQGYYQMLWQRAAQMPNVTVLGPLIQPVWHQTLASARALLYPGPVGGHSGFREIACIVAIEAQALGTPIISCAKGAVPQTMGAVATGEGWACDVGRLIGQETTECATMDYIRAFADAVETLLRDDGLWQRQHQAALQRGTTLGWDGVAAQWEADWLARFAERNAAPWRVTQHLRRTGEREGLHCLDPA